jgi:hypothetical protein
MSFNLRCRLCDISFLKINEYLRHYRLHRNVPNVQFPCFIADCDVTCSVYSTLLSHISRCHGTSSKFQDTFQGNQIFKCEHCDVISESVKLFTDHLRSHVKDGLPVGCPFEGCSLTLRHPTTFSSHLSRAHNLSSARIIRSSLIQPQDSDSSISLTASNAQSCDQGFNICESDIEMDSIDVDSTVGDDLVIENMALFYLKLEVKHLIPVSTIQKIVEELSSLQTLAKCHLFQSVTRHLTCLEVPEGKINEILLDIDEHNTFCLLTSGPFRSASTRKTFCKRKFDFVAPVSINVGSDKVAYVPINESLRVLYAHNKEYISLHNRNNVNDTIISDICDGNVYKRNVLLSGIEQCFGIILYQDSFEVANPLGSAKTKHKLLAMYYTLTNIAPERRSGTDQCQLVLLCKESVFKRSPDAVMARLITDLGKLETDGILLEDSTIAKAVLCCIAGDNLGSNCIGGFTENFSTSPYFCRFCETSRSEFHTCPYQCSRFRTIDSYNQCVQEVNSNSLLQVNGVKRDSIFNSLLYFHVCLPGLPPCLGHDLFEGFVAYDMLLFINYFIKNKKWFTYERLNKRIKDFSYKNKEKQDQPCIISENAYKIPGQAVQNWVMLRLSTLLIGVFINDKQDPVWILLLTLRRIVEIICSVNIKIEQLCILTGLIEEYLEQRRELFPDVPLRPKHHFLCHYPKLTLEFGPLMRTWTMNFERKHSYFKRLIRRLQNFKNVPCMLAEKHQMLQSYYTAGNLFPNDVVSGKAMLWLDVQNELTHSQRLSLGTVADGDQLTQNVVVFGTVYKKGLFVIIHCFDDIIRVGKIVLICVKHGSVYLLVDLFTATKVLGYDVYALNAVGCSEKVALSTLHDYEPLSDYRLNDETVIVLKHAL